MNDMGFDTTDNQPLDKIRRRIWSPRALMLSLPLLLALGGLYLYLISGRYVSTDNAYVSQNKVSVSSTVAGVIVEVKVRENMRVKRGDVLFRIEAEPYEIALRQAEAKVAAARVNVAGLQTNIASAGVDIKTAKDEIAFAAAEFERQTTLMQRGFTTHARYQEAQLALQKAREELNAARTDAARARSALGTGGGTAPAVLQEAIAEREKAAYDLSRTVVRAPLSGVVSQTDRLQVGTMIPAGLPAVSIVADDGSWVEANFKETDLDHMAVGQPAEVHLDAYPSLRITGHVASIGAGTGAEFSILPAQNANGNWVKVTQRVPVRIAIDAGAERPLIAGLSADVKVDTQPDAK